MLLSDKQRKQGSDPVSLSALGRRIVVVGATGAGKTTMGQRLSGLLSAPAVDVDALFWQAHWTEPPLEQFRERVRQATTGDAWVVSGNYGKTRDLYWPRAQTIVWLDYSLSVLLWRLTRRTSWRLFGKEELWAGNRESWRTVFLSRDSIYIWLLRTYSSQAP